MGLEQHTPKPHKPSNRFMINRTGKLLLRQYACRGHSGLWLDVSSCTIREPEIS